MLFTCGELAILALFCVVWSLVEPRELFVHYWIVTSHKWGSPGALVSTLIILVALMSLLLSMWPENSESRQRMLESSSSANFPTTYSYQKYLDNVNPRMKG
ncbi:hypothetical protein ANCDUO_14402 [Ancylostoma duodenale]|uniref:Uncharacterized protein n=1 Tax=Ancylostoma duodenale TaxID=51022 RepID=A0A0C2GEH0_9BILA|nr:hypothetical protein ANCDUO_14402 [Ancylostoma duodenale]